MTHADDIKRTEHSHIWQREADEHYVEPEWCSRRLFEVEQFRGGIWDPACGFGNIVASAKAAGLPAFASDIVKRGPGCEVVRDFFEGVTTQEVECPTLPPASNIVTNPPFDLFKEFALHALSLAPSKVAMIWLVRTLPAARWLQNTPLARVLFLTPRPSMPPGHVIARGEKPGGGKQDFCWLIWDKAHIGPASVGWLQRGEIKRAHQVL